MNVNENAKQKNILGRVLKGIGLFTFILGILIGLFTGFMMKSTASDYSYLTEPNPLRWVYGTTIIISSFVSGVLFIGFGEVILILDKIKYNTSLKNEDPIIDEELPKI